MRSKTKRDPLLQCNSKAPTCPRTQIHSKEAQETASDERWQHVYATLKAATDNIYQKYGKTEQEGVKVCYVSGPDNSTWYVRQPGTGRRGEILQTIGQGKNAKTYRYTSLKRVLEFFQANGIQINVVPSQAPLPLRVRLLPPTGGPRSSSPDAQPNANRERKKRPREGDAASSPREVSGPGGSLSEDRLVGRLVYVQDHLIYKWWTPEFFEIRERVDYEKTRHLDEGFVSTIGIKGSQWTIRGPPGGLTFLKQGESKPLTINEFIRSFGKTTASFTLKVINTTPAQIVAFCVSDRFSSFELTLPRAGDGLGWRFADQSAPASSASSSDQHTPTSAPSDEPQSPAASPPPVSGSAAEVLGAAARQLEKLRMEFKQASLKHQRVEARYKELFMAYMRDECDPLIVATFPTKATHARLMRQAERDTSTSSSDLATIQKRLREYEAKYRAVEEAVANLSAMVST